MPRLAAFLLADLLVCFSAAAPVPRRAPAPPPELTRAALDGHWLYAYSGMDDGWIAFEADGTYTAQHHPGTDVVYFGTYAVSGNVVTLYENVRTGDDTARWVGKFVFDFAATKPPKLAGFSNGATPVALTRRVD